MQFGEPIKKITEANDSWDGMFPVNINKGSIPKIDLNSLRSEEEQFRVYDISSPSTLKNLGILVMASLMEYENIQAPLETIHLLRKVLNRSGYDFNPTQDRLSALAQAPAHVDFPLTSWTSELYPYQIDQTFPGNRIEDDGIERKLGYKIILRIHSIPSSVLKDSQTYETIRLEGEIVPQDA